MNANTDTQRTNAQQGHDHTHEHGSYHWNGRDDNRSMTSTITSIPTTVADRDHGSHAGAHKSNANTRTDTNSNFNSSANYRPQTPDSTLKVKEIIGSLSTVLGLVKNLDSVDTVQEMEMWKERAFLAEVNITSLKDEIESLKKEVTVWENRTKRIEKRCDWCE